MEIQPTPKQPMTIMNRKQLLTLALLVVLHAAVWAANTKTSVTQVTATVTLSSDVDYVVTGETPFADNGLVDITKTDHAVLILERTIPSAAISMLSTHVRIKGAVARNNVNCQVRLYGTRGAIILPYANSDKPLTVYSDDAQLQGSMKSVKQNKKQQLAITIPQNGGIVITQ